MSYKRVVQCPQCETVLRRTLPKDENLMSIEEYKQAFTEMEKDERRRQREEWLCRHCETVFIPRGNKIIKQGVGRAV